MCAKYEISVFKPMAMMAVHNDYDDDNNNDGQSMMGQIPLILYRMSQKGGRVGGWQIHNMIRKRLKMIRWVKVFALGESVFVATLVEMCTESDESLAKPHYVKSEKLSQPD